MAAPRIRVGQRYLLPSGRVVVVVELVGNDANCIYESRRTPAQGAYDLHLSQTWLVRQIRVTNRRDRGTTH